MKGRALPRAPPGAEGSSFAPPPFKSALVFCFFLIISLLLSDIIVYFIFYYVLDYEKVVCETATYV
jgi:hypothetical protein